MSEFTWSGIFLLVEALVGFLSGAEITRKLVCSGTSVAAFQNLNMYNCNANVSLYIESEIDTLLATWSAPNCIIYSEENLLTVSLDANGTIWIHNVHYWDEATYVAISVTDRCTSREDVQIIVMDPPTEKCKPKIMRLSNALYAYLPNVIACGRPIASLFWKNFDGASITRDDVLPLTPGKEAGTYNACIEGPALTCVKNVTTQEHCSSIIIERTKGPLESNKQVSASSKIKNTRKSLLVMVGIFLAF